MLGPKFGVPIEERKQLLIEAKFYREEALATIVEEGSYYFQPDIRG
jgi:hypothetical protein